MKTRNVYIIVLLIVLLLVSVITINQNIFISADCGYEEQSNHYRVGSYIHHLTFRECTAGYDVELVIYDPEGVAILDWSETAEGETLEFPVDLDLDQVGRYSTDYHIYGPTGCTSTNSGFYSDPYQNLVTINTFNTYPSSVKPGYDVEYSLDMVNNGDLPVTVEIIIWNNKYSDPTSYPLPSEKKWYEESGVVLNVGDTHTVSDSFTIVPEDEEPIGTVRVCGFIQSIADGGSLPQEWYIEQMNYGKTNELSFEELGMFTLTVNTEPDECLVTILSETHFDEQTSSGGSVVFSDLMEDYYAIMVSKDGYTTYSFDLSLDNDISVSVSLRKPGGDGIPGFEMILFLVSLMFVGLYRKKR